MPSGQEMDLRYFATPSTHTHRALLTYKGPGLYYESLVLWSTVSKFQHYFQYGAIILIPDHSLLSCLQMQSLRTMSIRPPLLVGLIYVKKLNIFSNCQCQQHGQITRSSRSNFSNIEPRAIKQEPHNTELMT